MKPTSPAFRGEPHRLRLPFLALLCLGFLASCALPGDAAPVVKIGLIAPFEGLGRPLGYTVLPVVQGAIGHDNLSGRFGRYRVALVAFDDSLHPPTAAAQARALAQDPDVIAVLGPWTAETASAVAPVLSQAGIPTLVAAPLAGNLPRILSLCPGELSIRQALIARAETLLGGPANVMEPGASTRPATEVVVYLGEAASAAEDLRRWRGHGWDGRLVGGPDLFRPWFVKLAGEAGEGTLALACGQAPAQATEDVTAAQAGQLAEVGVEILLQALADDVSAHGRPGREGLAEALARLSRPSTSEWYQVQHGQWQRLE